VRLLDVPVDATPNNSYFPILVDAGHALGRDGLYHHMRGEGVVARRYFYPLISDFPMYRGFPSADSSKMPVARAASDQVLCLPIYPSLADADVERIAGLVRDSAVARAQAGPLASGDGSPLLLAA
jgi:dTDP-4-amino-4,6-dideoxygalactose transaminase